jgi:hypothetical protein
MLAAAVLLILRSTVLFSSLIAASAPVLSDLAEPVVTPPPDDWAVPAELVPGGGGASLDGFAAPPGSPPALLFNPPGLVGAAGAPVTPAPTEPALGEPAALPLLLPADDPPAPCANEETGDVRIVIAATAAAADASFIGNLLFGATRTPGPGSRRNNSALRSFNSHPLDGPEWSRLRKLIAFDDDTLDKLTQLARDRMATFQELADEAFADLLKKHGIPIDLKDALRKSARLSKDATPKKTRANTGRTSS